MVKKFIRSPSKVKRAPDITSFKRTAGTQAKTYVGKVIRANNRSVPLNASASLHNPKSGNFATKRRPSKLG
jgi:hypothetical protein